MVQFTNREMTDMHFYYGMAQGNAHAARRMYHQRFPQRIVPAINTFIRIHARLSETGSFKRSRVVIGRPATVRTVQIEEAVLNEIEMNPETSTRKIAHELNIAYVTVWQILKDEQLYPYHIQRVQALLPRDLPLCVDFCNWLRDETVRNPSFLSRILFTEEACFSRNVIINFHNNHVWAEDNPHVFIENNYQEQFSLNV